MTDKEKQSLLQLVKDEVAREHGYEDFEHVAVLNEISEDDIYHIATRYADELMKASEEKNYHLLKKYLPSECQKGETEVKFCTIRNSEGNECQYCLNHLH